MKPFTVADIIPTMSFHTSNSLSSTHQAFRFTEDPESAQLFLSVDSLQCRRPLFPQSATTLGPLTNAWLRRHPSIRQCTKPAADWNFTSTSMRNATRCSTIVSSRQIHLLIANLKIIRLDGAKRLRQRLTKAAPINGRHIRSLYVGVLAINGQLVYISSKKGEVYPNLFEDDDFTGLASKAEPSQTPAGSNTILIETNLIGGNLARNKQYVAGQTD
ncbi:hypothetical protein BKA60DRAFT_651384 [Fusarium oxysporum]|nr:hypothetical protein BKA60DRAFT_651384 [Fusarium oxysporum]